MLRIDGLQDGHISMTAQRAVRAVAVREEPVELVFNGIVVTVRVGQSSDEVVREYQRACTAENQRLARQVQAKCVQAQCVQAQRQRVAVRARLGIAYVCLAAALAFIAARGVYRALAPTATYGYFAEDGRSLTVRDVRDGRLEIDVPPNVTRIYLRRTP